MVATPLADKEIKRHFEDFFFKSQGSFLVLNSVLVYYGHFPKLLKSLLLRFVQLSVTCYSLIKWLHKKIFIDPDQKLLVLKYVYKIHSYNT